MKKKIFKKVHIIGNKITSEMQIANKQFTYVNNRMQNKIKIESQSLNTEQRLNELSLKNKRWSAQTLDMIVEDVWTTALVAV